jgi:membrane associated rhomboid family serine protease
MLPITATRRSNITPYVTVLLIIINTAVFLWETTLSPRVLSEVFYNSLVPCNVGQAPILSTVFGSLLSMFLHGGWVHLAGNMVFLMVFGPHVEEYYGHRKYLLFYIIAGFGSALLHTLFNTGTCGIPNSSGMIPVVGASGAIFGVMGAFILLYPGTRIQLLTFFVRIPMGLIKLPALVLIGLYFVINLLDGLFALAGAASSMNGVAVWGHIGGFVAGLLFTFVATMFKPAPPVDPLENLD